MSTSNGRACRIWNLSVTLLISLTIYNILLTLKLMYSPDCSPNVIQLQNAPAAAPPPPRDPCMDHIIHYNPDSTFSNLDLSLGRWDNSRTYRYFDSILVGDKFADLGEEFSVCLATQSSADKLYSLAQVANHWSGQISVALFASNDEDLKVLLKYVLFLRECFVNIRNKVNFHLAINQQVGVKELNMDFKGLPQTDCLRPEITLRQLFKEAKGSPEKWRHRNVYPQNHLRNLARRNCQTMNVLLTDVDIIPSFRLAEELDKFLRIEKCKDKCAYVIPTYELDERVRFPPNKTELVRLANKGLARPFHQKIFIFNQFATNFSRWQNAVSEIPEVHVSHRVTNFEFLYEPFYVSADTVPPHDERFVGYGYTRNTQVYEMYVAGYEFLVLSPVFLCHWGLQSKRGRPVWREQQNSENRKRFESFKYEIFAKYSRDPLHMVKPKT